MFKEGLKYYFDRKIDDMRQKFKFRDNRDGEMINWSRWFG